MKVIEILNQEVHWKCNNCFFQNITYVFGVNNYFSCGFCQSVYYVTTVATDVDGVNYDTS